MTLKRAGELELIRRIRAATVVGAGGPAVRTGIGDDTAVLQFTPGAAVLATTDLLLERVHFRRPQASARDIGWKAAAVGAHTKEAGSPAKISRTWRQAAT